MIEPASFWQEFRPAFPGSRGWVHRVDGLMVLRSISTTRNGEQWIHVSTSRRSRMPTWDDLSRVKRDFLGEEVEAYQVMAKKSEHVNVHSFCLHLWAPVDGARRVANLQDLIDEVGA